MFLPLRYYPLKCLSFFFFLVFSDKKPYPDILICKNLTHQRGTTGLLSQSKKYRHLVTINFYAKRFFNLDDLKSADTLPNYAESLEKWRQHGIDTSNIHPHHHQPPSALPLPPLFQM